MKDEGKVMTVRGPVEPADLGMTLCHEHLLEHMMVFVEAPADRDVALNEWDPITRDNAAWLRQHWSYTRANLIGADWRFAATEVNRFKLAGGSAIVDSTSRGIGRDVWGLRRIADDVNVHIVAGSGYYVEASYPWDMGSKTEADITAEIVHDVTEGADGTDICSGVIGEIGTSDPVAPREWEVVRAAAAAHHETGAPIQIHAMHRVRAATAVVDTLVGEMEVSPRRIAISHVDVVHADWDYTLELADSGVFLEYDLFGFEYPTWQSVARVSDSQRLDVIERLLERGHGTQLLLSHDIGVQARLGAFGGSGYDHIPSTIIPMMVERGLEEEAIRQILIQNPREFLTIGTG